MVPEVSTIRCLESEAELPAVIAGGFNASVKEPNILVHALRFKVRRQNGKKLLDKTNLQGNVAIVESKNQRTIRMAGPGLKLKWALKATSGLRADTCHIQDQLTIQVIIKVGLGMEQTETYLGCQCPSVVRVGLGPTGASGPQRQRTLSKIFQ